MRTTTQKDPLLGFMKDQLDAQLLRYAAGDAKTCPQCGDVMDWRRAVNVCVYIDGSENENSPVKSYTFCCDCYAKNANLFHEAINKLNDKFVRQGKELTAWLDIISGREGRFDSR